MKPLSAHPAAVGGTSRCEALRGGSGHAFASKSFPLKALFKGTSAPRRHVGRSFLQVGGVRNRDGHDHTPTQVQIHLRASRTPKFERTPIFPRSPRLSPQWQPPTCRAHSRGVSSHLQPAAHFVALPMPSVLHRASEAPDITRPVAWSRRVLARRNLWHLGSQRAFPSFSAPKSKVPWIPRSISAEDHWEPDGPPQYIGHHFEGQSFTVSRP